MTCVQKIKRSVTLFAQFITTSFGLREFFGFCEIRFSEQTTFTQKNKTEQDLCKERTCSVLFAGILFEEGNSISEISIPFLIDLKKMHGEL